MCKLFGFMTPRLGHPLLSGAFANLRLSRESRECVNWFPMQATRESWSLWKCPVSTICLRIACLERNNTQEGYATDSEFQRLPARSKPRLRVLISEIAEVNETTKAVPPSSDPMATILLKEGDGLCFKSRAMSLGCQPDMADPLFRCSWRSRGTF